MTAQSTTSPQEVADRLSIRELFDACAHCADRRDAKAQMALFTEDTRFLVYMDATAAEPTQALHGRESLAPVFDNLNTYVTTTHFNGQSSIALGGDRATGESYCIAHHVSVDGDGTRTLMIASIRYLDEFVRQDGQWLFAEPPAHGRLDRDAATRRTDRHEGSPMIRVSVMYPITEGASFDLDYWLTKHIPMVSEKCGDAPVS